MNAGSLGISAQRLGKESVQRDSDGSPMITDLMDEDDFIEFAKVLKKLEEVLCRFLEENLILMRN